MPRQQTRRASAHLSSAEARAVALAAQGFGEPAGTAPDRRRLARVVERLGAVQLDSVNVLVRSHYLPIFSRLGAYPTALLDGAAWGARRALFEYWGHQASLLPLATQPLFRWRMERAARGDGVWPQVRKLARDKPGFIDGVRRAIEARGPTGAAELDGKKGAGGWWGWGEAKIALEHLFWCGAITTAHRRNFERIYDLTERVLPRAIVDAPTPDAAEAQRALLTIAMRALGVATEQDLRDYFRLDARETRARLDELVESGALEPAAVEDWAAPAFIARGTRPPRALSARALLSPFDSLIWSRPRTTRLFGFDYRIEIYVPAHKRVHGYYVLPYLYENRLAARVDLKADRAERTLRVRARHLEPHAGAAERAALREDLAALAAWLGLERVR